MRNAVSENANIMHIPIVCLRNQSSPFLSQWRGSSGAVAVVAVVAGVAGAWWWQRGGGGAGAVAVAAATVAPEVRPPDQPCIQPYSSKPRALHTKLLSPPPRPAPPPQLLA